MAHPETHDSSRFGAIGLKLGMPFENRIRSRLEQMFTGDPIKIYRHYYDQERA